MSRDLQLFSDLLNLKLLLLAVLVFVPLQLIIPMHAQQKVFRKGWKNDFVYVFLNGIIVRVGLGIILTLIFLVSEYIIPRDFKHAVASQPHWIQLIELIVLADFGFYCMHRLFHTIPYLWSFHAVHHSIEELDWLAAHRVHPVDQILTKGLSLVPFVALGFSAWTLFAFSLIYFWHSLLLHSNVRVTFPPLRWLVTLPEVHHWHHSNEPGAHNKNFSAQLPLWDLVFGTAYMPNDRLPLAYGTSDPVPATYVSQLLYPFAKIQTISKARAKNRHRSLP